VLPFPMAGEMRLPPWSWVSPRVAERLHHPPAPRVDLDEVESALWSVAVPSHGLPLALRCLALRDWASMHEALPDPGPANPGQALAAALLRVTSSRSGKRMAVDEAACEFAADPAQVQGAAQALQQLVRGAQLPW
jgi:hypothetical protein